MAAWFYAERPTALNVTFPMIRLASSFYCSFPSHHSDIIAAAVQMLSSDFGLCISIVLLLCIVSLGRVVYHCDTLRKKNQGLKLNSSSVVSYVCFGFSGCIVFGMTVAASILSTKPEHRSLFIVFVQTAAGTLGVADVGVILCTSACAMWLTSSRSWAPCNQWILSTTPGFTGYGFAAWWI
jgi:hypothetical protein